MFTGIVEGQGVISALKKREKITILTVQLANFFVDIRVGQSVAVDGVCLTVVKRTREEACFEITTETLILSTLGEKKKGDTVNLEKAIRADARLDGHFVQGHIDGVTTVQTVSAKGIGDIVLKFSVADKLASFLVAKGSVTLNGVSLTILDAKKTCFWVMLIPHTWKGSNLGTLKKGDRVNIEIDILAKYVKAFCMKKK